MPCHALSEGTFTVNQSKCFVQFDRDKDSILDKPGSLLVEISPFLIIADIGLILIDPGLGMKNHEGNFQIIKNLTELGINSTDINIVLLSHLHKDHIGGVAFDDEGEMKAMFPKANYVYQFQEMENALTASSINTYESRKLEFLKNHGNKTVLNGDSKISKNIYCEISGGHTKFHQVFWIDNGIENFFYGGDVLPQFTQLNRKFIAKYDVDGKKSASLRTYYGHKCAEEHRSILFFHSTIHPIVKVIEKNGRFEKL